MKKTLKIIDKIKELKKIKSIICNDCKEYHHIGEEFFKITGVSNEDLDMVINGFVKKFKEQHYNHNIEIKDINVFPFDYKVFNWDTEDFIFDELDDIKKSDTFTLVSYPDGKNVEDVITADDGLWVGVICSVTGCNKIIKKEAKMYGIEESEDIFTGKVISIINKDDIFAQGFCRKHFKQKKKCDNFIEEIK